MVAATSSPVLGNKGPETQAGSGSGSGTLTMLQRAEQAKNARGNNKPKCITCGNVARSRCPFQSCKSCCAKAQNPCHIHVLKPNATLADRGASANAAQPEQRPSEVPQPGPPAKVTSVRHLSSSFAQYNNVHSSMRSRKPLSVKEALVINEWRFAKLKEYKDNNIEAENESFDRYMQNISLLEEVFDVNSETPQEEDSQLSIDSNLPATSSEKTEMVSEMKAKLRSNPGRIDQFRKRIRLAVDQGLRNIQHYEPVDGSINLDGGDDPSTKNWWGGKTSALTGLNDKLNRAQNEDDLKLCIQIRAKTKGEANLTQKKIECTEISKEGTMPNDTGLARESQKPLLKYVRATEIDRDALNGMEYYFSSLEEIEEL